MTEFKHSTYLSDESQNDPLYKKDYKRNKYTELFRSSETCADAILEYVKTEDINERHLGPGLTVLHMACGFGYPRIVEFLIQQKAEINATTYFDFTPLHYACVLNNYEIVKMLVDNGAYINHINHEKKTPISYCFCYVPCKSRLFKGTETAYINNKFNIIKLLIANKANINVVDNLGNNVLGNFLCSYSMSFSNVKDSSIKNSTHSTYINILKIILENPSFLLTNAKNQSHKTLISYAVEYEEEDIFKLLVKKGASITYQTDPYDNNLLHLACRFNDNLEIIKYLINEIPDALYSKNILGNIALTNACINGNYFMVEYLAELMTGVKYEILDKKTKLSKAEKKFISEMNKIEDFCHKKFMSAYYELMKDPDIWIIGDISFKEPFKLKNVFNKNKDSLIHSTCYGICNKTASNKIMILKLLMFHGIDINSKNNMDELPFDMVLRNGNQELIKFFQENGAKSSNVKVKAEHIVSKLMDTSDLNKCNNGINDKTIIVQMI